MPIGIAHQFQHVTNTGRSVPQQHVIDHGQSPAIDFVQKGLFARIAHALAHESTGRLEQALGNVAFAHLAHRPLDVFEFVHDRHKMTFLAIGAARAFQLFDILTITATVLVVVVTAHEHVLIVVQVLQQQQVVLFVVVFGGCCCCCRWLFGKSIPKMLLERRLSRRQFNHAALFLAPHAGFPPQEGGKIGVHFRAHQRCVVLQFRRTPQIHQRRHVEVVQQQTDIVGRGIAHAAGSVQTTRHDRTASNGGQVAGILNVLEGQIAFSTQGGALGQKGRVAFGPGLFVEGRDNLSVVIVVVIVCHGG
mmetsp:Transcript_9415/g.26018  ORF Transcript_9415/g.26018 Transcript_9415/m.26018 type:complete len:305 (-) Transcript_9415:444-1358(-)